MGYMIYRLEPDGTKTVIDYADDQHQAALLLYSQREKGEEEKRIRAEKIEDEEDTMRITVDNRQIEIRDMGGGEVLVMTRDESIWDAAMAIKDEQPDAVKLLTEPDLEEAPEDMEGLKMAIMDKARVVVVIDLEAEKVGFAYWNENEDDE